MNRRWFLKLLSAIPFARHLPQPKVFGDGFDGDLALTDNKTLPPKKAAAYAIINVMSPVGEGDVVTKAYVDSLMSMEIKRQPARKRIERVT